jgi:hypothetical protein
VAEEKNGAWGQATEVPGLGALNKGRSGAAVESVWCGSAGNCAVAGYYADTGEHLQGFVATERNGPRTATRPVLDTPLIRQRPADCCGNGNAADWSGRSPRSPRAA